MRRESVCDSRELLASTFFKNVNPLNRLRKRRPHLDGKRPHPNTASAVAPFLERRQDGATRQGFRLESSMALALCLASSHALSPRTICSRRAALYGAAAALSLPESVRAGQLSGADVSARLDGGIRTMDVLLRDWDELTIDCTYAEVPRSLLETKNKELLLEKVRACVEIAGCGLSGGAMQHPLLPQAAASFDQPRPVSRVGRAGRPRPACSRYRP